MKSNVNKYLVVVAGPTAVGKTALSVALAKTFDSVVVSADSRQFFREMEIGTAKPSEEELKAVRHYFVNHLSIQEEFSAGKYQEACVPLLKGLFETHDVVFLTGGSGLYIRAVAEGFDEMPVVPVATRRKWEALLEENGLEWIQQTLQKRDPTYFAEADIQNTRRLVRALSLIDATGETFSSLRKNVRAARPFKVIPLFCNLPREELYARIDNRVDEMIARGLTEEVKTLLPYRHAQAMQTVGYRELVRYWDGEWTLEEAIEKIKQHTRNYAKRQITWFRNQGEWIEVNPPVAEDAVRIIQSQMS